MKIIKKILVFDLFVQSLIISMVLLVVLTAIVEPSMIFCYLYCQLAMGFWQVLSGIFFLIATGSLFRLKYLAMVIVYFANGALLMQFGEQFNFYSSWVFGAFWFVIPFIFAAWYFKKTLDEVNENAKTPQETITKNQGFDPGELV